jgi:hypothetical protein
MSSKYIEVEHCGMCPYMRIWFDGDGIVRASCALKQKHIRTTKRVNGKTVSDVKIPRWCPLIDEADIKRGA